MYRGWEERWLSPEPTSPSSPAESESSIHRLLDEDTVPVWVVKSEDLQKAGVPLRSGILEALGLTVQKSGKDAVRRLHIGMHENNSPVMLTAVH